MQIVRSHEMGGVKWITEPDNGMYEALNKGIRMAGGDIIGLVHSDDVLFDSHVVSSVAEMFDSTGADMVYADGLFVDSQKTDKVVRCWRSGPFSRWKVRHGWLPLHPTCFIRRELFDRYGLYDEGYRIAADTDLLVRLLNQAEVRTAYLPRFVVRMRIGGLSTDSSLRRKMWREDVAVYAANGYRWPCLTKVEKMAWKLPQFVRAKLWRWPQ